MMRLPAVEMFCHDGGEMYNTALPKVVLRVEMIEISASANLSAWVA